MKGIIIAGSFRSTRSSVSISLLAEKLGWPLFADITSPARPYSLPYYDLILKIKGSDLKPEAVLHLGDRFVSKTLLEWLPQDIPYALVANHPFRHDPKHQVTERIECDPVLYSETYLPAASTRWDEEWKMLSQEIENNLGEFFKKEMFTEPSIMRNIASLLPPTFALFLSNSMPIRDADLFFFPKEKKGPLFANRGVSGIDGIIATAIGVAEGSGRTTLAILGDQAFLHDLNSLAQLKKTKQSVIFLVFNNGGGAIFSFLPIAKREEIFEEYFAAAHTLNFESAARLFEIPYFHPTSHNEIETLVRRGSTCIIEVTTNRKENFLHHQEITQWLKQSSFCTVS